MNKKHAQALLMNTKDKSKGLQEYKGIERQRQGNSFDCSIYIMLFIQELTHHIISKSELNIIYIDKEKVTNL